MARYEDLDKARKLLGLGETASFREITEAYRRLAHKSHPDKARTDNERMKDLNWAYELVSQFCNDYRYGFDREDFERTYPEEKIRRRYRDGWFNGA